MNPNDKKITDAQRVAEARASVIKALRAAGAKVREKKAMWRGTGDKDLFINETEMLLNVGVKHSSFHY